MTTKEQFHKMKEIRTYLRENNREVLKEFRKRRHELLETKTPAEMREIIIQEFSKYLPE